MKSPNAKQASDNTEM